jgi:hypothetical protein
MPAEVITFHRMLAGCIHEEFRYWEFFISTYGSLAQNLVERHFASLKDQLPQITFEIFQSVGQDERSFLKEFAGSSEREFLIHFERKVVAIGRKQCAGETLRNEFDNGFLGNLFDKVPLVHQEVGLLAMKGNRQDETNKILRVPLALVQTGEVEVLKKWSKILDREVSSFPRLEDPIRQQIESQQGPNCPAIKIFSDVLDGRIVWRDKQQVENHVSECLYCLDRETTLKEMLFYLRSLNPLSPQVVQGVLANLSIQLKPSRAKSSLFTKVMKVFK